MARLYSGHEKQAALDLLQEIIPSHGTLRAAARAVAAVADVRPKTLEQWYRDRRLPEIREPRARATVRKPRARRATVTPELREQVMKLRRQGHSMPRIGGALGIGKSTVGRIVQEAILADATVQDVPGPQALSVRAMQVSQDVPGPQSSRSTGLSVSARIMQMVAAAKGPLSLNDIAVATGARKKTLQSKLWDLRDNGKIARRADGTYVIIPSPSPGSPGETEPGEAMPGANSAHKLPLFPQPTDNGAIGLPMLTWEFFDHLAKRIVHQDAETASLRDVVGQKTKEIEALHRQVEGLSKTINSYQEIKVSNELAEVYEDYRRRA